MKVLMYGLSVALVGIGTVFVALIILIVLIRLMEKVIELTYELKNELNSLPLFQEYKRVKELIDNSDELNSLKAEIAKSIDDKERHNELLNKYNSNQLIIDFKELEKEVSTYLKEICEIINKK